jgi:hypothetical protein
MDCSVQIGGLGVGRLPVNCDRVQEQATIRSLNVATRAAETIVQIEVTEGGIDVVAIEPVERFGAEVDAFRIAGRSAQPTLGFEKFFDLGGIAAGCGLLLVGGGLFVRALLCQRTLNRKREGCREKTHQQSAGNSGYSNGHGSLDLLGSVGLIFQPG